MRRHPDDKVYYRPDGSTYVVHPNETVPAGLSEEDPTKVPVKKPKAKAKK